MAKTFGKKVIDFNRQLNFSGELPKGFQVLNPYVAPDFLILTPKIKKLI
jgi:hypothetical protein